jgi:hypothetical protein
MVNQSTVGSASAHVRSSPSTIHIDDQEIGMKGSGRKAHKARKKVKRGVAVHVVCYPKPITKALLIHVSRMATVRCPRS